MCHTFLTMSNFFTIFKIDTWQCRWPFQNRILYDIQRTGTPDNPRLRCDVVGARGEDLICSERTLIGVRVPASAPIPVSVGPPSFISKRTNVTTCALAPLRSLTGGQSFRLASRGRVTAPSRPPSPF